MPYVFVANENKKWYNQIDRFMKLLYDDGIVKGVINGQPIGDTIIEITDFYVEPFFVGQGIGTLLIEYLIQQVRKKGVHKIILWVIKDNVKARKFYEAEGFVNSGKNMHNRRYYKRGLLL